MSFIFIAAILASLGLLALATVALAAGLSILSLPRIKSFALTVLWVVPALAVVGMIGFAPRANHGVSGASQAWGHSAIQRRVERREVPESADRAVVTATEPERTDLLLTAEARVDTAERADVLDVTAEAAERASTLETEKAIPPLDGWPVPPQPPVPGPAKKAAQSAAPVLTGLLKVRETKSQAPDWAGKDPVPRGESVLVPLSSQMWATMKEAEQQVTERAAAYVKEYYHDEYPIRGDWVVPVAVIEQTAVDSIVGEEIDKDFGGEIGTKKMYRAHLRLDVGPSLRNALHDSWRTQVVDHRLTGLGGVFGLATLLLAAAAGYFRLDDATNGQYRRRLKFAAAALVAAGGLVAWQVVA